MADDPIDAFDKLADDIRRKQEELDAVDALRKERAAHDTKRKPEDPSAPDVEPPESK